MFMHRSAAPNIPPTDVELQAGAQRAGLGSGGVAQVVGHRRRVDDLAGVQPALGVEDALDLPERLVQLVAEQLAVELAAGQAVAVLAGVDAAVLADEVLDLHRDRAHHLDLAGLGEVDEGADVQAADRAVAVEAGLQAVPVQHVREPGGVLRQVLGSTAVSSTKASGRRRRRSWP
jgi:hypothetical protein